MRTIAGGKMNDSTAAAGKKNQPLNFAEIHQKEKEKLGLKSAECTTGLSLSGGGIRSASFGLGVIQALLEHGVMQKIDYLSTVSGGGYIGTSLTWNRYLATDPNSFFNQPNPFGVKGQGVRSASPQVDQGDKNDSRHPSDGLTFLDFIRQHGNYLTPSREMNSGSFIGVALRNLIISVLIYFAMLLIAISLCTLVTHLAAKAISYRVDVNHQLLRLGNVLASQDKTTDSANEQKSPQFLCPCPWFLDCCPSTTITESSSTKPTETKSAPTDTIEHGKWVYHSFFYVNLTFASIILFFSLCYGFVFSVTSYVASLKSEKEGAFGYKNRNWFQWLSGILLYSFLIFLFLSLVPLISDLIGNNMNKLGTMGAISGMWAALSKFRKFLGAESVFKKAAWIGDRLFEIGAFLFLFAVVIYSYYLCQQIGIPVTVEESITIKSIVALVFIAAGALFFAIFVNINHASLGRMYRDRLMEAFLPDSTSIRFNTWDSAWQANSALLADMCKAEDGAIKKPYHLINTNAILTNSKKEKFRRRGGDSFVLSPLYCGSDATGFEHTHRFMRKKNDTKSCMTLATAMAISGAAVNPHTGVAGEGPTRGPLVSILMTAFNLRLGAWVSNPCNPDYRRMNYIRPGLCSLLCFGHKESSSLLELTDGGHFENLGLYELIRRRVGRIIVSDAGVDKDFKFGDLANAIEKVRTDFGVSIRFEPEDHLLNALLPGSGANSRLSDKYKLAEKGYIVGTIKYPSTKNEKAFEGQLLLIKSTLVSNLPVDLYSYKAHHEDFPDQPTSDQFFDEKQFEVYRELGYRLADSMCNDLPMTYS